MEKIFMHTCCAPCSISCIEMLRELNLEPVCYWYNLNIHPYIEYKQRKETLQEYLKTVNVELVMDDEYGLVEFLNEVGTDIKNRCSNVCYRKRLEKTAQKAKELGYKKFTTTLLVSPYQDTEKLVQIGNEMADKYDLEFVFVDFKSRFRQGQQKARELGLYMQKYCGCIFSEADRYKKLKID